MMGLRTFPHRHNDDGTIDSICRECYITVSTSFSPAELEHAERFHVCDPGVLAYWAGFAKLASVKPGSKDRTDHS